MGLNEEIITNQKKRFDNGTVRTFQDGNEYLCSPGYSPVNLSVFKSYVKTMGWKL